jgi:undecaprenyl pyrophosphate synthase
MFYSGIDFFGGSGTIFLHGLRACRRRRRPQGKMSIRSDKAGRDKALNLCLTSNGRHQIAQAMRRTLRSSVAKGC